MIGRVQRALGGHVGTPNVDIRSLIGFGSDPAGNPTVFGLLRQLIANQGGSSGVPAGTVTSVQGPDIVGASQTGNPVLAGALTGSSLLKALGVDANGYLLSTLGTGLNNQDDNVASHPALWYPAQGSVALGGTSATFTISFGSIGLGGPGIYAARYAEILLDNGTIRNIVSGSLQFSETVGGHTPTITYQTPTFTTAIAGNSAGKILIPLTGGVLKNVSFTGTFSATINSGTLTAQLVLSDRLSGLDGSYWAYSGSVHITGTAQTLLLAAPPTGMRYRILGGIVTNTAAATNPATISIEDGSGGSVLMIGNAAISGGFLLPAISPHGDTLGGVRQPTSATGIYAVAGSNTSDTYVSIVALLEPI